MKISFRFMAGCMVALSLMTCPAEQTLTNVIPSGSLYLNDDVHNEAFGLLGGFPPANPPVLVQSNTYILVWGPNDGNLTLGTKIIQTPGVGKATVFVAVNPTVLAPVNPGRHGPSEPVTAAVFLIKTPEHKKQD